MIKSIAHYRQRIHELGLLGVLRRIGSRTRDFLFVWSQSGWWALQARLGMSDASLLRRTTGGWKTVDELIKYLADRSGSTYLLPHESRDRTTFILTQDYPNYVSTVLSTAEAITRNEFCLLGQVVHGTEKINWHRDPVTGWNFPIWHRNRLIEYLYTTKHSADPIILWELNRHQHFITLGIAYWLTGEQQFAETFTSQVLEWIAANPIQHGLHWFYPLEVSIRLIAWTTAFQFFRDSQVFQQRAGSVFLKSLWQQADFVSHHLQFTRTDAPNNHLIAELTGLVVVGNAFPEFRSSASWVDTGLRLLNQQAVEQTHPDGVNKEQATGYHRCIAELLLLIVSSSRQGNLERQPVLENTLQTMLEYTLHCVTPAGAAPMWGDSDYGRALGLGLEKDFWDFRPLLAAGAVLFDRPDWKCIANCFDEEAFWLLGLEGLERWKKLEARKPGQTSHAFPNAGIYILRDSWEQDADIAFFRCGPFGLGGEGHCAHAHNDLLSFVLWINGEPLLVDSGTYTYHGELRDHFRLTSAHNTVMVDCMEQATPLPNFNWRNIPQAKCTRWTGQRVEAKLAYPNQVDFTRDLNHQQKGTWEISDTFMADDKNHMLSWFFHFATGLHLEWDHFLKKVTVDKDNNPFFEIFPPEGVDIEIKSGWFSRDYARRETNPLLFTVWTGKIPHNGISFAWRFVSTNNVNEVKL